MLRILIAEDDKRNRESLASFLFDLGHHVKTCGDGQEAMDSCLVERYDILITDIKMPKMDGIELLRKLRMYPETKDIIVVIITGHGDMSSSIAGLRAGAFDYLLKPVHINELISVINKAQQNIQNSNDNNKSSCTEVAMNEELGNMKKLLINQLDKVYLIDVENIIMITKEGRKSLIHTRDKTYETYDSMQHIINRINDKRFFRSHKSYFINTAYVTGLSLWSNKVYKVHLESTKEPALMTADKVREFKDRYCS